MHFRLGLAAAVLSSLFLSVLAVPTNILANTGSLQRRGAEGEPFQCPDPKKTAAAKQALTNAGAMSTDIAIAMLENGCEFTAAFSIGNNKVEDAAELGVYRNNWHMIRTYCDHFKNTTAGDWMKVGSQIHNDVAVATKCQRQLWDTLGETRFFGLQRYVIIDPKHRKSADGEIEEDLVTQGQGQHTASTSRSTMPSAKRKVANI
ncbi:MAG: hypothetical protein Q9216_004192 [Gyalolechia sp. 2 TL-2023]